MVKGKRALGQHDDGGTEGRRDGQRWVGGPSGLAGVKAVRAMGYELEELRGFKERTEAEIARKLFEVEIALGNWPTPEPSIRKMVEHYYRSHRVNDHETLADIVLRYVAHSTRNARVTAEGQRTC